MWRWALLVVVMACTPTTPRPAEERAVELGRLQMRDHVITVHAATAGPRFTVADRSGTVVLESVDAATFQARFPALFRDYETAFASIDGKARALDASL